MKVSSNLNRLIFGLVALVATGCGSELSDRGSLWNENEIATATQECQEDFKDYDLAPDKQVALCQCFVSKAQSDYTYQQVRTHRQQPLSELTPLYIKCSEQAQVSSQFLVQYLMGGLNPLNQGTLTQDSGSAPDMCQLLPVALPGVCSDS